MATMLAGLVNLATLAFAVSSMLAVGLGHSWRTVVGPFRHGGRVLVALIANFLLVPLLAYFVIWLLQLDEPLAVGLMLIATGAGAPFLIQLTTAAGADVALCVSLLVLLLPATVIFMPLLLPLLVPEASMSALSIALPLILTMLLPLALGLFVRARAPAFSARVQPTVGRISSYTLVALVTLTVLANLPGILRVTMGAVLAALLVTCGAFAIGYLLGGSNANVRHVLGLGTGQRNIAAATVVATQGFNDPNTLVMVVVAALVGLAALFPIAARLRQLESEPSDPAQGLTIAPDVP